MSLPGHSRATPGAPTLHNIDILRAAGARVYRAFLARLWFQLAFHRGWLGVSGYGYSPATREEIPC